jgi:hypothetical protein
VVGVRVSEKVREPKTKKNKRLKGKGTKEPKNQK